MYFKIKENKEGKPYVLKVGENNKILSQSEAFDSHQKALENILSQMEGLSPVKGFIYINDEVDGIRKIIRVSQELTILDVKRLKP